MEPEQIEARILEAMPGSKVEVTTDGVGHYEALVISAEFEAKRSVARHQRVYGALGEVVGRELHALALRTFTPEEWQARHGRRS